MRKSVIGIGMLALLSFPAVADTSPVKIKAGLWEQRIEKFVVDGKDQLQEMRKTQEALGGAGAFMAKAMEEVIGIRIVGPGVQQLCSSGKEMRSEADMIDPKLTDGCRGEPKNVKRAGNVATFEIECGSTHARHEITYSGDSKFRVHSRVESKGGSLTESESVMTWLGADCQGLRAW